MAAIGEVERIVKARWVDALVVLQDRLKLVERFDGCGLSGCGIFVVLPERQYSGKETFAEGAFFFATTQRFKTD